MGIRFKYEPAGSIVGLAAYATGDNKARSRSISRALSGRRYPSRTSRADTTQLGGRWIDPLDTFEGPEEALKQARIQQRAQMNAFRRDPSRARKYGTANLLPRWQSQAEIDQIQKDAKEKEDRLVDERKWRRTQAASMVSGLPDIPEHADPQTRKALTDLATGIRDMQYSGDFDPTEDDKWDDFRARIEEYHSGVNGIAPANPNQYGYVMVNGKLEPAGDRAAEYTWKPGMASPVMTEWYQEQKKADAAAAEKAAKEREAELKAQKDAAEARVKERNDFQQKRYEHYLGLVGTEYTGLGPKPPTNRNEAMQMARADTDEEFGQPEFATVPTWGNSSVPQGGWWQPTPGTSQPEGVPQIVAPPGGMTAPSGTVPATTPIPPPLATAPAATPPDSSTGVLPWPLQQPAPNPQAAIPAAQPPQQTGWPAPTTPQTGPFFSSGSEKPPHSGRTVLADISRARAGDVNAQQALEAGGINWKGITQSTENEISQMLQQPAPAAISQEVQRGPYRPSEDQSVPARGPYRPTEDTSVRMPLTAEEKSQYKRLPQATGQQGTETVGSTIERTVVNPSGEPWEKAVAAKGFSNMGKALDGNKWIPAPSTKAEYDALPNGTRYLRLRDGMPAIKGKRKPQKSQQVYEPFPGDFLGVGAM